MFGNPNWFKLICRILFFFPLNRYLHGIVYWLHRSLHVLESSLRFGLEYIGSTFPMAVITVGAALLNTSPHCVSVSAIKSTLGANIDSDVN